MIQIEQEQARRRRREWQLSPEERLRRAEQLTRQAFQLLQKNPAALRAFQRRQHAARRLSEARRLEEQLLKGSSRA